MVLFISSDSDFASVISALGSTQCSVGLLVPPNSPSSLLRNHATVHLEWDEIFNLKSSDETITESLIDLSQEDHATPRGSTHDAHFPWLSRRIEIKAPDHHSLGILQHPLLGSPCQKPTLKKTGTLHALSVASPGCHTSSSPGHSGQSPTTTLTNLDRRLRSFSCFEHLVYVLKDLTAQTSSEWHPWGKVAEMLLERDPEAFRRLGVWRFKSYVKIAKEEANIVSTKDPRGGDGEVSLNPRELWTVAAI
ncbi:hypothetical protein FRB90_000127 [Tulasnella sp. 427]|nr:hypothetical protein FRB90_000127 [Tulasnella sp. 427]